MSQIIVNDLFDELKDENNRLLEELTSSRKCTNFLEEFKNYLKSVFENCIHCKQDFDIQSKVEEFELIYKSLISGNNDSKPTIVPSSGFRTDPQWQDFDHQTDDVNAITNSFDNLKSQQTSETSQLSCDNVSDNEDTGDEVQNQGSEKTFNAGQRDSILQKSIRIRKCVVEGCGKTFKQGKHKMRIECHLNSKHFNIKPYGCEYCERTFCGEENLYQHRKSHDEWYEDRGKYRGAKLPSTAIDYESDNEDLNQLSKEEKVKRILDKSVAQMMCAFDACRKQYNSKGCLEAHLNAKHFDIKPYICDVCGTQFSGEEYLIHHKRKHTQEVEDIDFVEMQETDGEETEEQKTKRVRLIKQSYKKMTCPVAGCNQKYSKHVKLENHINSIHYGIKPYICEICRCKFTCNGYLIAHRKTHSIKTVECDFDGCTYLSNNRRNFLRHQKIYHPGFHSNISNDHFEPSNHKPDLNQQNHSSNNNSVTGKPYNTRKRTNISYSSKLDQYDDSDATIEEKSDSDMSDHNMKQRDDESSGDEEFNDNSFDSNNRMNAINNERDFYYESEEEAEEERVKRKELMAQSYKRLVCLFNGCNRRFPVRPHRLESHMNHIHFKRRPYVCRKCNVRSTGRDLMSRHLTRHQKQESIFAEAVGVSEKQYFKTDFEALDMNSNKAKQLIKEIFERSLKTNVCAFGDCKKMVIGSNCRNRMESHLNTVHFNRKPYDCSICGRYFSSQENLDLHQRVHKYGPRVQRNRKNDKIYSCEWEGCDYKARKKVALNEHVASKHTLEKPFQCPHCDKKCSSNRYLQDHIKHHWGPEKKFHCDKCTYSSPIRITMERHMKRHTDVKKFHCEAPDCNKIFKTLYEKNTHFKCMHIRGRPFVCDWPGCDKTYKFKAILEYHKSCHLNERKFKCSFEGCGHSLNNLNDLRTHQRRHIARYVCSWPACGQRFKTKCILSYHMNMHQNIKEFVCEYPNCGRSYYRKPALYRHRIRNGHQLFHNKTT